MKNRLTPIELERLRPQIQHLIDVGKATAQRLPLEQRCLAPISRCLRLGEADVQWLAHFKSLPEERSC